MQGRKAKSRTLSAEKSRHVVMLTRKGKILIPVREVPPEQRRGFGVPKITGRILDMRAVLK